MKIKVCVFTGTRAEYGILRPLLFNLKKSKEFILQIIAGGMHVCELYGKTIDEIKKDGFTVDEEIDFLLTSNTRSSVCKSMGLAMIGFSDKLEKLCPDILVLLGDRFETFAAASAACTLNIPIAHIHGGEITLGAVDNQFRHAITKLSNIHFTSTKEYKHRVLQMGEDPQLVFNTGALGLESLEDEEKGSLKDLEAFLNFKLDKPFILATIHPETLGGTDSDVLIDNFLWAVKKVDNYKFIFTGANSDAHGNKINAALKEFCKKDSQNYCFVNSLGKKMYTTALCFASMVAGNSSSGIIEAPFFKVPVVNIGIRQEGRVKPLLVTDCSTDKNSILNAFNAVLLKTATASKDININPYYKPGSSNLIVDKLKKFILADDKTKKFFDI